MESESNKTSCITKCFQITITCIALLLFVLTIVYLTSDDDEDTEKPEKPVQYSPTTFLICEETVPSKHLYYNSSDKLTSDSLTIIKPLVNRHEFYQVLQSSRFPERSFLLSGLVRTVVDCYSFHHNLIIRPDDVWAAIMSQFSWYASRNANKLGSEFNKFHVEQGGSQRILFETSGAISTLPYDGMVFSFQKDISYVFEDDSLRNWILPGFSTTTENDHVTIGLMFMGQIKTVLYKRSKIVTVKCGVPHITLDGTVGDWIEIKRRLKKLNHYGLDKWYDLLLPIITQFEEVKEGRIDAEFWREMVYVQKLDYHYVTGWITAFCIYHTLQSLDYGGVHPQQNQNLEWLSSSNPKINKTYPAIVLSDIPSEVAQMEVKIQRNDENGKIYKGVLLAGHVAAELKEDGETVQPTLGWAMALQRGRNG
ncbi:unnamed protein product [Orchesella dallaii]|uniref:Uncharacterized protein n=1 Tax=Orchesella dallaii TaxID=48710 RepID=A0ABP1RMY2_9HEXA